MNTSPNRPCVIIFVWNNPPLIESCLILADTLSELGYLPFFVLPLDKHTGMIRNANYAYIDLNSYIQKFCLSEFEKIKQHMSFKNGALFYNGINISEDTRYETQCLANGIIPPLGCKTSDELITQAALYLNAFSKLLNDSQAVACYLWNGLVYPPKALKTVCNAMQIPAFSLERGLLPDRLVIDPVGINYGGSLGGEAGQRLLWNYTPRAYDAAVHFIKEFRSNKRSVVNQGVYFDKGHLYQRLGLDPTTRIILYANQIDWDTNILYYSPNYLSNAAAIRELVESAKQLSNAFIVVKPHPEDTDKALVGLQEILDDYGIIVSDIALPALLEAAYAIVVRNSTVGLEGVLFGKPVITLGLSAYSGKGFTYDTDGKGEMTGKFASFWEENTPALPNTDNLLPFLSYLLHKYHFILKDDVKSQNHNLGLIGEQLVGANVLPERTISTSDKNMTKRGLLLSVVSSLPQPAVSVIVPTYNRPAMLRMAIQSILDQTFQDFEIIVVNDAGQDAGKIVASFNSPKMTYLSHEKNKGLAAARNTGIKAARGKYIAYLDDDDIYYPQHLEILSSYLENHDCKVAYTDSYRATQQLIDGTYRTVTRECLYSLDFDYDRILWQNFVPVLCFMHEKTCFEQTGLFDENLKRHEDWDLWIRMSRHFNIDHIPSITSEYTHREDGTGMVSGTVPMFLRSFDAVTSKYREMTANRPEIQDAVKNSRFMMVYIMFEFLGRKLASLRDGGKLPDTIDGLVDLLGRTGATKDEIFSAFYQEAARMEQLSSPKKALQWLEHALNFCDYNVFARRKLSELLLGTGNHEAAICQMELLFQSNPVEPKLLTALSKLYMAQGNKEKARFFVDQLLAVEPDNQEGRDLLVTLLPQRNT